MSLFPKKKRAVVCASGRGSNFQAVYKAIQNKQIQNCQIVGLIVDRSSTLVESFAKEKGIPVVCIDFLAFPMRSSFDSQVLQTLLNFAPDFILALGYMRIFSKEIIASFPNKIINVHPSLLPAFPGLHAQRKAIEYGVQFTGATVHFVDEGIDSGRILQQAVVEIQKEDTEDSLSKRILEKEHQLIVSVIQLLYDKE